jgi:hypothetical protein
MKNSKQGYKAKHDPSVPLDADLAQALRNEQEEDGGVSCESAHRLARQQHKAPRESGRALDLMDLRITRCQLGLFGYTPRKRIVRPAAVVDPTLAGEIQAALENGRLCCKSAWEIAERLQVKRLAVAEACEALKIKVSDCQLGAF